MLALFFIVLLVSARPAPHKRENRFAEPTENVYLVNISTTACASDQNNLFGCDVSGWTSNHKDFGLGSGSSTRQFLTYQTVPSSYNGSVIVDLAVGNQPGDDWVEKSNGIWAKYGPSSQGITAVNVLFGQDAIDPRPNWVLVNSSLTDTISPAGQEAKITFRRGPKVDYSATKPTLKYNNGKFKMLQVADLHYSTGVGKCLNPVPANIPDCQADPRTLEFLEKVLAIEQPDLVLLTGDQNYGPTSPDPETAIFKVLAPYVERGIPFAVVLGNHDDETYLTRDETLAISIDMPYSMAEHGPTDIFGSGNYFIALPAPDGGVGFSMYFLDSGAYTHTGLGYYDWIKTNQLDWVQKIYKQNLQDIAGFDQNLAMAFFHIPLLQYNDIWTLFNGNQREAVSAGQLDTGARRVLGEVGVQVATVGHDHLNDYCVNDYYSDAVSSNQVYLCYGGGVGEGGYGGQGFIRRVRVWEVDSKGSIAVWKRSHDQPDVVFDETTLVVPQ